jgi:uncharacterized phage protein (TIGR02218 family)
MKSTSSELAVHIASEVTTLATCWRIARRDGVVLGFTTHDRVLVIDYVTYRASTGFTPSTIAASNDMSVDNLDVAGVLSSSAISEADLRDGRFDFAAIEIFEVNWSDLSQGRLNLASGRLGEVTMSDGRFTAEIRGLTQALQQPVGEVYSAECRADLGDARCKVNLAAFTVTGAATAVASTRAFTDSTRLESDGWFDYGLLTWVTGSNAGLSVEVKSFASNTFALFDAMPNTIEVGDAYSARAGCDKRLATCKAKFANILNFRGEPFVPGPDSMLDYPGIG